MFENQGLRQLNEVPTFMSFRPGADVRHWYIYLFRIGEREGHPYKQLAAEAGRAQHGVGIRKHMNFTRSRLDHTLNAAYLVAKVTNADKNAIAYTLVHDTSSLPLAPHAASRLTESYMGKNEREIITLEAYGKGPFKEVDGTPLPKLFESVGAKRKEVVFHITHPYTPLSKTCDSLEAIEGSMLDYLALKSTPKDGGSFSESVREAIFNDTKELHPGCLSLPEVVDSNDTRYSLNYRTSCYEDKSVGLREATIISIMKRMLMKADENEEKGVLDEYGLPVKDAGAFYRMTDRGFKQTVKRFVDAYPIEESLCLRLLAASRYKNQSAINRELGKDYHRILLHPPPTIHLGVDTTGHGKNGESVNLVNHFLRGTDYKLMLRADEIIKEETGHDGILVPIIGQSPPMDNIYCGEQPLGDPMTYPQTVCGCAAVVSTRGSNYVSFKESERAIDRALRQIPSLAAYLNGLKRTLI